MSYQTYQEIKAKLTHNYKGYDMAKILSFDMVYRAYGNKTSLIRGFVSAFLFKKIELPKHASQSVLFSMGPHGGRKDYYEILNFVRTGIESDFVDVFHAKCGFRPSIKNFITSLWLIWKCGTPLTLSAKLSLGFKISHYKNTIDYLEQNKTKLNYKKFCSFCSAHAYEAILDQYFHQQNMPTYTLQHGLYFLFKTPSIDVIAYENMISEKLLCWGQFTKDEFVRFGIPSERIEVSGYPRAIKQLKPYIVQADQLNILLLCARKKYDLNNQAMIKLCYEFTKHYKGEVRITLKTHPALNQAYYKQLSKEYGFGFSEDQTIQSLINDGGFDFAIAYNSTAYIDSYLNNLIALHYQDEQRENNAEVLDDRFSTASELMQKISRLTEMSDKQATWNEIESQLEYLVGYGHNRYAELLDVR